MKASIIKNKQNFIIQSCSIMFLLCVWIALSFNFPSILIASPLETLMSLNAMVQSGELLDQLVVSASRMMVGFLIGMFIAIIFGLLAGKYSVVYEAFRPIISLILGIPPIILVVLAMVWFGTGSMIPIVVVSILVFPTFFLNTAEGWRNIDHQLLEMALVYNSSPFHTLKNIILPGLAVPIFTAVSLATGASVRITIMAELLGSDSGIGFSLALARINIDTAKVFAWTIVSIAIIIIIDQLVISPLKKVVLKWDIKQG